MKLISIVGARPQFIKAAVISRTIANHNSRLSDPSDKVNEIILHTGQHYDENMSQIFFEELAIPKPHYNLGVGSGSHGKMTGAMLEKIEKVLIDEKPDCVLVYGDTNTTLAGALAAAKLYLPLAHVEAGLRSFNRKMPEEINRVVADHVATILFCPTETAVKNLEAEGIGAGSSSHQRSQIVALVGDVMYDAFLFYKQLADKKSKTLKAMNISKGSYCLATVHREENTDDLLRLQNIFNAFGKLASADCPFIVPIHPRTRKTLKKQKPSTDLNVHVRLIEPVSYLDMIYLEANAKVILTDSGGVQKEAYFAQIPCLTLRNETEWTETLAGGWNRLTGAETKKIMEGFNSACENNQRTSESYFGDGHSGEKILDILHSQT